MKTGVMIATPVRHWSGLHQFSAHLQDQLKKLAEFSAQEENPFFFSYAVIEGGLCRARNKIVQSFLKSENQWLLFWDDDIMATADDVLKLLSLKMPVVAGLYCTREERCHWVSTFMFEVKPQKKTLLQVMEVGTGFKLYHRQVFEELARIYGDSITYTDRDSGERINAFFQQVCLKTDTRPDGDLLSEDYFLDHMCRHVHIGIFVDTSMKLRHGSASGVSYPTGDWPPIPGVENE